MDKDFFIKIKNKASAEGSKLIDKSCDIVFSLDLFSLTGRKIKRSRLQYEVFNQYPPHHFLDAFGEEEVSSHYSGNKEPFALYVHLPFCIRKCTFCCFQSNTSWSVSDIDQYISCLEKEIILLLNKEYVKEREVSSLYWGGGTPTVLSCAQVDRLMRIIRNNISITSDAEIIFESTPESITSDKIECFLRNGFNRLSIGMQTFDKDLLKKYNRSFFPEEAIASFNLCRARGFNHINIDLMHGLAGQTIDTYLNTLNLASELKPANVTYYLFSDSESRSQMARIFSDRFPCEEERVLMHIMSIERFRELGYIQITPYQFISSWQYPYAQQEHKARNGPIHALGVTGHSFLSNCEYYNYYSMANYKKALSQGRLPIKRGRYLDKQERMIRFVVYSLQKTSGINRQAGGVDKNLFRNKFGAGIKEVFRKQLDKVKSLGLIEDTGDYIRLSYKGLLYPVETSMFFYLDKDRRRCLK